VPPEQFIWLRNAGNIITGSMSSTMRSLALACVVKGAREIVIMGHTDCQVGKTSTLQLIDRFRALGIERHLLPDNLNEYFGLFGSERQNVLKAVELVRSSPLISSKIPVQGLLIEIQTGKLDWLVNGYETLGAARPLSGEPANIPGLEAQVLQPLTSFNLGEMKFPENKIGEIVSTIGQEILERIQRGPFSPGQPTEVPQTDRASSKIPVPPGFKLGDLHFPESKIGDVVSAIGQEISERLAHRETGPAVQGKNSQQAGAPPKLSTPLPIRPRMSLRRNPK
jgi:carbonic anhydrase